MYKKNKKILIVPNAEITEDNSNLFVEKATGELSLELIELGYSVRVFGQILSLPNKMHVFNLNKNSIEIRGIKRKKNKILNYIVLYFYSLVSIIKSDFVYIFYPSSFKFIGLVCFLLRKKYGLYIRGMNDLDSNSSKFIIKHSKVVLCVSDNFKDYVNQISRKIYSRSVRPLINFSENDLVNNRHYLKKRKYNVLYLGRMTNDKGVIELLHATKLLEKNGSIFDLTLVGDGEYLSDLKQLANELDVAHIASFKGAEFRRDEIKNYFLNADIYILPSYHEGFPRTLYESMIFGTPIITTFVGGIGALMKENINCLKIVPKSVDSIVEQLDYSMNNYDKVAVLASNASIDIKKIFETRKLSHAEELDKYLMKERNES
ncbi:glycosyltransferase family 4 protein [Sphingobacterium mizutaii]|uniref:glycosyltransferase family 4 protein n=1 Tax=Sphingobacterium mizutaii TaxID=1010 RepID=UPI00162AF322|nr:glycosyltransferase family 4 protein [Sphingobacterium mizutaii]